MSLIVAGRFTTFPAAEAVAEKLYERGFVEEDVNLVFVNPRGQHAHARHAMGIAAPREPVHTSQHVSRNVAAGAVAGAVLGVAIFAGMAASLPSVVIAAGVGAWLGAWIGAIESRQQAAEHHELVLHETRNSGVLLTVHVTPESQAVAADVLRESHAADIERASGRWQGGHWADFDPTRSPEPYDQARQPQG
ncbi:hypothetical protein [Paraburkholderia adhaesiva]|uniref:hypothetical protein n=1 Tax=Paraburkholderia adhaesiva TaxID=2883244 RepID=UPI001F4574E2|nr:hypothetical protein [Paraburkholderia adhaesiva]